MREIFLGFIQGLTEFLPVSSSAHLAIAQYFVPGSPKADLLFDVLLHLATLMAVLLFYWRDIVQMIISLSQFISSGDAAPRRVSPDVNFIICVIIGTIPTGIIGVLMEDWVEQTFTSLLPIGIALLITGVLLFTSERFAPAGGKTDISYLDALLIGIVQGIAVFPGISRSGSTISTALFRGIDRKLAAKFSFFLSIPAVCGAVVLEGRKIFTLTGEFPIFWYLAGMLTAFIVGYFAIAALIRLLVKQRLAYFSYYCWVVGICLIVYRLIA